MEYQIVRERRSSLSECFTCIEKKVNKLCREGWKPQGGVSISVRADEYTATYYACQAMIKEEEIKSTNFPNDFVIRND